MAFYTNTVYICLIIFESNIWGWLFSNSAICFNHDVSLINNTQQIRFCNPYIRMHNHALTAWCDFVLTVERITIFLIKGSTEIYMQLDSNFDVDISWCNSFRYMHYLIQKRGAANVRKSWKVQKMNTSFYNVAKKCHNLLELIYFVFA